MRIELRERGQLVALCKEGGAYRELNQLFWQLWMWAEGADRLGDLKGIYGIPFNDPISIDVRVTLGSFNRHDASGLKPQVRNPTPARQSRCDRLLMPKPDIVSVLPSILVRSHFGFVGLRFPSDLSAQLRFLLATTLPAGLRV